MKQVAMKKVTMKKAAMKKVMKKAMKKSKIAKGRLAKALVLRGSREKTSGGLKKDGLTKNKNGKVVSKKASAASKKRYAKSKLSVWGKAVAQARKELGVKGFLAIGGKTAAGKALLAKARSIYTA